MDPASPSLRRLDVEPESQSDADRLHLSRHRGHELGLPASLPSLDQAARWAVVLNRSID